MEDGQISYDPQAVIAAYELNAQSEDEAEQRASLRVELPREFIKRYLQPEDVVLDAGGGTGINAILMASICQRVTLLDLTPGILALAEQNVSAAGMGERVEIVAGDITDLSRYGEGAFSFVVCVGDALSYALDQGPTALAELVRVAKTGAILILGCDSKYGFLRLQLAQGNLEEAWGILRTGETMCGMGPRTRLYTVSEMWSLLENNGCRLLETAATPSLSDTVEVAPFLDAGKWEALKKIELEICTRPELLGMGTHLLFIAQKMA